MHASRRQFLTVSSFGIAAALGLASCSKADEQSAAGGGLEAPQIDDAQRRSLPIPPLANFEARGDRLETLLVAQTGTSEILPGVHTPTWGFNGAHLGPTLKMSRGDKVDLRVRSTVAERTSVHWHGALVPAKADGGPHSPIDPGEEWTASFIVDQPAATLWYHPHPHGATGVQAYRGLAGMIIVDDEHSERLGLPHSYGVDDIPVVLMDANFNEDGSLNEQEDPNIGLLGKVCYVNGIVDPVFEATTQRVRLRLLNGSTMRFHHLAFADGRECYHVASDSGLFGAPRTVTSVTLGPGERCEVVVELGRDEQVMLRSVGFDSNLGVPHDEFAPDFHLQESHDLLLLRGPNKPAKQPLAPMPTSLPQETLALPAAKGLIERHFELNGFQINGKSMDMMRVDLVVAHEQPEVWVVKNGNADWIHNFHIHNCAFKVIEVRGTDVDFDHEGWKDTVTLPPNAEVKLMVVFGKFSDNHYPYMYHCHMLFHEDQGLMGQFMMIKPGQKAEIDTAYSRALEQQGQQAESHSHGEA